MSRVRTAVRAAGVGVSALGAAAYWAGFRPRSQLFGSFPYEAETEEKVVALSFDDGPNEPYTSRLLDTLDAYEVRATFFQVGRCAQRFPSATRRVVQSGHVLGNHSYSHSFTRYLKQPRQEVEIIRSQEIFYSITGVTPALYRPPWLGDEHVATSWPSSDLGNLRSSAGNISTCGYQTDRFGCPARATRHDLDLPRRPRGPRRSPRSKCGGDRPADRTPDRSGLPLHNRRPVARNQRVRCLIARVRSLVIALESRLLRHRSGTKSMSPHSSSARRRAITGAESDRDHPDDQSGLRPNAINRSAWGLPDEVDSGLAAIAPEER